MPKRLIHTGESPGRGHRSNRKGESPARWPTSLRHSENINFFGAIEVDIEGELAQLGPTGDRPPRVRGTLF
jgi:hypothetical protein